MANSTPEHPNPSEAVAPPSQPAAYDKAAIGKVDLADTDIEASLVASQALDKAASAVAKKIHAYRDFKPNEDNRLYPLETLIIYNEGDALAVRQGRVFNLFLDTLSANYSALLPAPDEVPLKGADGTAEGMKAMGNFALMAPLLTPAVAAHGIGVILQSTASILSFFRTDTKVTGVKVQPSESGLVAALAHHLREGTTQDKAITLYHPALFPLETSAKGAGLGQRLLDLQGVRQGAEDKLSELQGQKDPDEATKALIAHLQSTNAAYDKFIADLLTPDKSDHTDALLLLFRAAALQDKLDNGAHWLRLEIEKAGGTMTSKTGGLWPHPDFTCGGGVVISYMLVDPDMTIVLSGQEIAYLSHVKPEDIQNP